jgi:hypothetical protein
VSSLRHPLSTSNLMNVIAIERVNFFKPRFTEGDVIFHESIKVREEDGMMGYKPKLRYKGVRSWVATPKVFE